MYDIRTTPDQLRAAALWATPGLNMADVELLVDDRMLIVTQGDSVNAFDTGGEPASRAYLEYAPLDRTPGDIFGEVFTRVEKLRDEAVLQQKRVVLSILHGSDAYLTWTDEKVEAEYSVEVYEQAWEMADSSDHETYDAHEGEIGGYKAVLDILKELAGEQVPS